MNGITEEAGVRLALALDQAQAEESKCVRLALTSGGAEMRIDNAAEEDHVFQYEERPVLAVDPGAAEQFNGQTLDFVEGKFVLV